MEKTRLAALQAYLYPMSSFMGGLVFALILLAVFGFLALISWYVSPLLSLPWLAILALLLWKVCLPAPARTFRTMRMLRRKGLAEAAINDLNSAGKYHRDACRIGKRCFFVRGWGQVLPLAQIASFEYYTSIDDPYETRIFFLMQDGRKLRTGDIGCVSTADGQAFCAALNAAIVGARQHTADAQSDAI